MSYWHRAYGWNVGTRIIIARLFAPLFPPLWHIVPQRILDKWHRIACDDAGCVECERYYALLEEEFARMEDEGLLQVQNCTPGEPQAPLI